MMAARWRRSDTRRFWRHVKALEAEASRPPAPHRERTVPPTVLRIVVWYGPIGHAWVDVVPLDEA